MSEFKEFAKIARYSRPIVVTEKIDGTNGLVHVAEDGTVTAGSRSTWITPEKDNHGFARWVKEHETELRTLGEGYHYGEWWGLGINRGYGMKEKHWSLFNVSRWKDTRPACCDVVPVLYEGMMSENQILLALERLEDQGSVAAPGFKPAEGVVIYHVQGNLYFKKTILHDEIPKSELKTP
ncbi:MAG TPA: RNA ligase family protein [Nitrososphaerales archaeon]|nr:RNA ligase family protein [Nitrososphaerales archaeon]